MYAFSILKYDHFRSDRREIVKLLLDYDADVNDTNSFSNTPLYSAAVNGLNNLDECCIQKITMSFNLHIHV